MQRISDPSTLAETAEDVKTFQLELENEIHL